MIIKICAKANFDYITYVYKICHFTPPFLKWDFLVMSYRYLGIPSIQIRSVYKDTLSSGHVSGVGKGSECIHNLDPI